MIIHQREIGYGENYPTLFDEEYSKLIDSIISATADPPVDQFYRVIQNP